MLIEKYWGNGIREHFRTKTGKNTIRIVGNPEMFMVHWIKVSGKMRKKICQTSKCSFCPGDIPKTRILMTVIDREDDKVKWFESGLQIFSQLKNLLVYNHISFDTDDVIINKDGISPFVKYDIVPGPESMTTPGEREKVQEFLLGVEKSIDKLYNGDIYNGDICNKCGSNGIVNGMACICSSCGNIIWGC